MITMVNRLTLMFLAAGRPSSSFTPLAAVVGLRRPSSGLVLSAAGLPAGAAAPAGVASAGSTNNAASSGAVVSLIMRLLLQIAIRPVAIPDVPGTDSRVSGLV